MLKRPSARRSRGWATYGEVPLRRVGPWRRRNRRAFQMFELNMVGWSALLAAGLFPSLLLRALGVPRLTALALGEAGTYSVLKVKDHLRWRASPIYMQVDGSPELIRAAVAEMRATGLVVDYEELPHDVPYDELRWQAAVKCRQADGEKVRTRLDQRGL